jgi:hypothetical protein
MLFDVVAANGVLTLLGLPVSWRQAEQGTLRQTGVVTSVLPIRWALGGIAFGCRCDRVGRTLMLKLSMLPCARGNQSRWYEPAACTTCLATAL